MFPNQKSGRLNVNIKPSSAWLDYGKDKKLTDDGMLIKNRNVTSASPAATPSTGSTPVPAASTSKINSPAGQGYVNSLNSIKETALGIQSQIKDLGKQEKENEDSDYLKYVRSLYNPENARAEAQKYENAQQRLADIQSQRERSEFEARKRYEQILDKSGGTRAGAEQSASVDRRRSNDELADIALQESAAARSAGVATDSYSIYLDKIKEANTPLTFEEAQSLGVPIGTTIAEAKARGLIPQITPEGFTLGEGQGRYDAQGNLIASRGKTYAPGTGGITDGAPGTANSNLRTQPGYGSLTANQKKQADSLNNLVRAMNEYRTYYDSNPGAFGGAAGNMFGEDAGVLQTKVNSIIFAAAQAEGTGALQAADRQVIEQIIPNPTSFGGALNTVFRGGKSGNIAKIDDQIKKYTDNLAGYGLTPSFTQEGAPRSQYLQAPDGSVVDASDVNDDEYAEMIADGYIPES